MHNQIDKKIYKPEMTKVKHNELLQDLPNFLFFSFASFAPSRFVKKNSLPQLFARNYRQETFGKI
jgi:hypothetical protein